MLVVRCYHRHRLDLGFHQIDILEIDFQDRRRCSPHLVWVDFLLSDLLLLSFQALRRQCLIYGAILSLRRQDDDMGLHYSLGE
jgi:hypothetical protein